MPVETDLAWLHDRENPCGLRINQTNNNEINQTQTNKQKFLSNIP